MKPQRSQLSRRKGFRLQEASMALNGLPAVNCARPGRWGNPFTVKEYGAKLAVSNYHGELVGRMMIGATSLAELRGKNLACWCGPGPCHADILLQLANEED